MKAFVIASDLKENVESFPIIPDQVNTYGIE